MYVSSKDIETEEEGEKVHKKERGRESIGEGEQTRRSSSSNRNRNRTFLQSENQTKEQDKYRLSRATPFLGVSF